MRVLVINKRENPLMPCKPQKARRLLKEGKAKVFKQVPFTIQLTCATGETTQPITLGVDPGYKTVGVSAVVDGKEEVLSMEIGLRGDMVDLNFGRRSSGYFDLRKLDGTVIHRSANAKKLKLVQPFKTLLWESNSANPFVFSPE